MDIRIGNGIDLHRFAAGRKLVLGGVEIPSDRGLTGHSDADVLLHALCDALLGAAGLPDIGVLFPNDDPKWQGAESTRFLADVADRIFEQGWRVSNVDLSVVCEKPKLAPFIPRMKEVIAPLLVISTQQVGIKATTAEGLGSIGRGEGVIAFASAVIVRDVQ